MQKQSGLSLVELMISLALGLMLMAGVVQMFLSGKEAFRSQQGTSRIQETGRLAIEFLSRDVRSAAYYGCVRPDPAGSTNLQKQLQNSALNFGGLHTSFDVGIIGYDAPANLPNGAAVDLGIASVSDSNILVVRSVTEAGSPIVEVNNTTQVFAFTNETGVTNGCVGDICQNQALVVSDCFTSRVFRASALSVASNRLTITHTDTWNLSVPHQNFRYGEVAPLRTVVYFIADGANGNPSLYQRVNADPAAELLEGVERMHVTYAVRPTTVPANLNPPYRLASEVTLANDWPNIASARIEVVVRSLDNNVVEEPQPYTFGGDTVTPEDRYLRQVFTTTVAIRSR